VAGCATATFRNVDSHPNDTPSAVPIILPVLVPKRLNQCQTHSGFSLRQTVPVSAAWLDSSGWIKRDGHNTVRPNPGWSRNNWQC
jgi:hypothetical protein